MVAKVIGGKADIALYIDKVNWGEFLGVIYRGVNSLGRKNGGGSVVAKGVYITNL